MRNNNGTNTNVENVSLSILYFAIFKTKSNLYVMLSFRLVVVFSHQTKRFINVPWKIEFVRLFVTVFFFFLFFDPKWNYYHRSQKHWQNSKWILHSTRSVGANFHFLCFFCFGIIQNQFISFFVCYIFLDEKWLKESQINRLLYTTYIIELFFLLPNRVVLFKHIS